MPKHKSKEQYEESWYWYLTGEKRQGFSPEYENFIKRLRRLARLFPGDPRCFECDRPLSGWISHLVMAHPSRFSPKLCDMCERSMLDEEAGVEVELSMLFADVRGSTTLAEKHTTSDFRKLIQRFYQYASDVLVRHNCMVNRLMGDQVIGLFVPRFAGSEHAKVAVTAALELLRATGHAENGTPWIPVGVGIHTGLAYVGAVGTKSGVNEIAVLGNAPNLAARLSSQAADGEVLISERAAASAGVDQSGLESRTIDVKGVDQPVAIRVLRMGEERSAIPAPS